MHCRMRIQYRYPKLYDFLISFLYPRDLLDRFQKEVGVNKTVFEIAAGYGRMSRFIHPSNKYYGIDLNKYFVNFGRKQGVNLDIKDIFDRKSYKKSDVYVAVDIVHHLSAAKLRKLFDLVFAHTKKKVIVIEPSFVNLESRQGLFGKCADWIFRSIDYDGFNGIERWLSEEEYMLLFRNRFMSSYGSNFSLRHQLLGNHHVVTFSKT